MCRLKVDRRSFLATSAATLLARGACAGRGAAIAGAPAGSPPDELAALDGLGQAELVRKKELTPSELIEAAIHRIEKLNPQINAVVTPLFGSARARIKKNELQGPFAGVPFLLKDLDPKEGTRLTYGSVYFKNYLADHTSEVVRRMEAAGLVTLGKTNTPEFGLLPVTEPKLFGPTRNPWNLALTPGGSSGGSAAAVAAGMVPLAQASDGGGSIRIPASCCGVFGLKISRGRNPEAPSTNDDGLSVVHCVSRSVRDSAALLDATQGAVPGDRWQIAPPKGSYLAEASTEPGKLRIALITKDFLNRAPHADCLAAVHDTAKLCEELGHSVEETELSKIVGDGQRFSEAFMVLWSATAASIVKLMTRLTGKPPARDQLEPWTWELVEFDKRHTSADIAVAWNVLQPASYQMQEFLTRYDALLTPVLGAPPLKVGELSQDQPMAEMFERLSAYIPFTPIANATGQPAMSVPLWWNGEGTPIGSHFLGRHGDEAGLFRLAGQLERARPWAGRWPSLASGSTPQATGNG